MHYFVPKGKSKIKNYNAGLWKNVNNVKTKSGIENKLFLKLAKY